MSACNALIASVEKKVLAVSGILNHNKCIERSYKINYKDIMKKIVNIPWTSNDKAPKGQAWKDVFEMCQIDDRHCAACGKRCNTVGAHVWSIEHGRIMLVPLCDKCNNWRNLLIMHVLPGRMVPLERARSLLLWEFLTRKAGLT